MVPPIRIERTTRGLGKLLDHKPQPIQTHVDQVYPTVRHGLTLGKYLLLIEKWRPDIFCDDAEGMSLPAVNECGRVLGEMPNTLDDLVDPNILLKRRIIEARDRDGDLLFTSGVRTVRILRVFILAFEGGVIMNNTKRRIHDGIVGAVITLGVALGYGLHPAWLLVPGVIGITLIQSAFTGLCPVYFLLDKTCAPETEAGYRGA